MQLATTQHLRRVLEARLTDQTRAERGKADLAEIVRGVRWKPVGGSFEAKWRYYQIARRLYPRRYRRMIGFGPAWFLHVDLAAPIPEISVTERIWRSAGAYVGPWASRADCQSALDGLRDLFELCRYPEEVQRAPGGKRCAYFDMGRCDAPCDGSAPLERYRARVTAAWAFATGGAGSWARDAESRMRAAAEALRFEAAGLLKLQLAFAQKWSRQWSPSLWTSERMELVFALPVVRRRAVKLFGFRRGLILEGPTVARRRLAEKAAAWLQSPELPGGAAATPEGGEAAVPVDIRMEQTWLMSQVMLNAGALKAAMVALDAQSAVESVCAALEQRVAEASETERPRRGKGVDVSDTPAD